MLNSRSLVSYSVKITGRDPLFRHFLAARMKYLKPTAYRRRVYFGSWFQKSGSVAGSKADMAWWKRPGVEQSYSRPGSQEAGKEGRTREGDDLPGHGPSS